ncbi:MAG: hypothetical protein A2Z88_10110 [Omnitrophica WOR_2 bacterium GWA2_47_8]|nr:MAG: hypothetical protein A2Z88_10110 [Omnitrophica WOR_2 bacterium GWA2_47_8]
MKSLIKKPRKNILQAMGDGKPKEGKRPKGEEYYQKVALKAYELYQQRGCCDGSDWQDWFEAEKIVASEGCGCKAEANKEEAHGKTSGCCGLE